MKLQKEPIDPLRNAEHFRGIFFNVSSFEGYTLSMFKRLLKFVTAYPQILLDPKSSRRAKFLPLAALVYLIMPIDLVPDMIPLLGEVDDIGLIILFISIALKAFEQTPPQKKKEKYGDVIDIEAIPKKIDTK